MSEIIFTPSFYRADSYSRNSWHYAPGGYKGMSIDKIDEGLASMCPLKRVAVPQDIARVVALLASSDSEWINGIPTVLLYISSI